MSKVKDFVGRYYHYACILMILFFRAFYLLNGRGLGVKLGDSNSYLSADLSLGALGKRVPLYPLFLKVCKRLVRWDVDMGCAVAAAIQCILSLLVLYFLYQTILTITNNRLLSWVTLVFYGCNAGIMIWDCAIMTESLAMDVLIVFFYMIVRYLNTKSVLHGVLSVVLSVVAAMIKPTCAVLTGVCMVMLVLQFATDKENRRKVLGISVAVILSVLYYAAYCSNSYRNYGCFNLTSLGPRHNLVTVLVSESYRNYPDKELVARIDEILADARAEGVNIRRYPTTTKVMNLFVDDPTDFKARNLAVSRFNKYCKHSDPVGTLKFKLSNVAYYWNDCYESTDWKLKTDVLDYGRVSKGIYMIEKYVFSFVHIRFCFIMLTICIIMTIITAIRKKQLPWYWLGLTGTILILLLAVYGNAYASFYRHTIFVLPFAYTACAMFMNELINLFKRK